MDREMFDVLIINGAGNPINLSLSFSGTTANYSTVVRGNNTSDSISVTMKLWKGGSVIKTWSSSGSGKVSMSKTAAVKRGQTYKLTVNATINGVAQPQQSVTRTCP